MTAWIEAHYKTIKPVLPTGVTLLKRRYIGNISTALNQYVRSYNNLRTYYDNIRGAIALEFCREGGVKIRGKHHRCFSYSPISQYVFVNGNSAFIQLEQEGNLWVGEI